MSKKQKVLRTLRNVAISMLALVIITVGAGVGYVWYSGQQESPPTAIAEPVATPTSAPVVKPTKPSANVPISAAIRMLTSPVKPGANASITVNTLPDASCDAEVTYNEVKSVDSGLQPKKADEFGNVMWTWTVEDSVPVGTWPVDVVCVAKGRNAVVRGDLVVKTD